MNWCIILMVELVGDSGAITGLLKFIIQLCLKHNTIHVLECNWSKSGNKRLYSEKAAFLIGFGLSRRKKRTWVFTHFLQKQLL